MEVYQEVDMEDLVAITDIAGVEIVYEQKVCARLRFAQCPF